MMTLNSEDMKRGYIVHFMEFTFAVLCNTTLRPLHVAVSFVSLSATVAEICTLKFRW